MGFVRLALICTVTATSTFAFSDGTSTLLPDGLVGINNGVLEWNFTNNGVIVDGNAELLSNIASGPQSVIVHVPSQDVGLNLNFTVFGIVALPAKGPQVIVGLDPVVASGIIGTETFAQVFGVPESQVATDLQSRNAGAIADLNTIYGSHRSDFGNGTTIETLVSFSTTSTGVNRGTLQIAPVPEPAPFVGLGLGLFALGLKRRRSRP